MGNHKGYWAGKANPKFKHGYTSIKAYSVWRAMIKRCTNPKSRLYKYYGERGIAVSPEWMDFKQFYSDMGEKPAGLSIERLDNNKGYSKTNCKWGTKDEQANNKRWNVYLEYEGERLTISQWAHKLEINRGIIDGRNKKGWPIELVLSKEKFSGQRVSFKYKQKEVLRKKLNKA